MYCTACGVIGDLRHFLIIDGEVYCRPSVEGDAIDERIEPVWFGGITDESGEVYGG
jgi:hypothetical protein